MLSRQTFVVLLKVALSAALIVFLIRRVQFEPLVARFQDISPQWTLLALAVFLGQVVLTGWRYGLIGRVLGAALPIREAINLMLIGQFFSQTLPSAIGGDAVRAYMMTRHGIRWGRAVSAVLCDRGIAMLVLMVIATATIPIFLNRISEPILRPLTSTPALAALLGIGALVLLDDDRLGKLHRWRVAKPFVILLADMRRIVFTSHESRTIIAISVATQFGVISSVWLLGKSLHLDIHFLDCLVLVPPIVVITLVPISIAGWGIREGAMIFGFALVGVPEADALALSVATGLCQIVAGIPGGLIWLGRGRPKVGEAGPPIA